MIQKFICVSTEKILKSDSKKHSTYFKIEQLVNFVCLKCFKNIDKLVLEIQAKNNVWFRQSNKSNTVLGVCSCRYNLIQIK